MKNICIFSCSIHSLKNDELEEMMEYDQELVEVIGKFKEFLSYRNIEIFKEEGNMLITEEGYYFSFYETDLV